jgi:polyisoprenoid-binding protein YceI
MISETEGQFKKFDAKLTAEKPDFTDAVIEVTIDAASIFTDEEKRDEHLRSPDFFDVEKYPNITFKSKSLKKVKDKNYKLVGDLTIKDVTKQVEFDVIFNGTTTHPYKQKTVAGFKVRGVVKRSDFKLNTGMPTAILSDEIAINSGVEFIKD